MLTLAQQNGGGQGDEYGQGQRDTDGCSSEMTVGTERLMGRELIKTPMGRALSMPCPVNVSEAYLPVNVLIANNLRFLI